MPMYRALLLVASLAAASGCATTGPPPSATGAPVATTSPADSRETPPPSLIYQGPAGLTLLSARSGARPFLSPGSGGSHADWSPATAQMVFTRDATDGTTDIWVSDRRGEHQRRVVDCRQPCVYAENPAWSPDGRSIAYWTTGPTDTTQVIRIADAATGRVRTTIDFPDLQAPVNPRWSPDGRRLVVNVEHYADRSGDIVRTGSAIDVIDLRGPRPRHTSITDPSLQAWYPDWSPDGSVVVFTAGNLDAFSNPTQAPNNLVTVRPDGTRITPLTHFTAGDPLIALPDWISDGSGLLVTVIHDSATYHLARVMPDGTALAELTDPTTGDPVQGAHARDLITAPRPGTT